MPYSIFYSAPPHRCRPCKHRMRKKILNRKDLLWKRSRIQIKCCPAAVRFLDKPHIWARSTGTTHVSASKDSQENVCVSLFQSTSVGLLWSHGSVLLDVSSVACPQKATRRERVLGSLQPCPTSVAQSASGGRAVRPQGHTQEVIYKS